MTINIHRVTIQAGHIFTVAPKLYFKAPDIKFDQDAEIRLCVGNLTYKLKNMKKIKLFITTDFLIDMMICKAKIT